MITILVLVVFEDVLEEHVMDRLHIALTFLSLKLKVRL
jgi:hypothetical protein